MKYCIVIPDGAADFPLHELRGKTPLEAAAIPNMDRAAREGVLGLVSTVPARMEPGSDVAMMSLLGYNPLKYHTGRAPLEAADLGITMKNSQWAFRCNLINVENRRLKDFSAGHISTGEAEQLLETLNAGFKDTGCRFHAGTGYRHLMLCGNCGGKKLTTNAPHQVMGQTLADIWPTGECAGKLIEIMERSTLLLQNHPVNRGRTQRGLPAANMIWLWGEGKGPELEPFRDRFGLHGAAISAVNLVRGMAKLVGWKTVEVPGITGYTDTNYGGKGRYAIEALERYDLVLVHIEAPDEASHEGDAGAKIEAIEQIDRHIVRPLMDYGGERGGLRLLVVPDHITSVESKRHMRGAVPLAMWGEGIGTASALDFTEATARTTNALWDKGFELMPSFLQRPGRKPAPALFE